MKIKKFEALEMSEALRAVREELGPNAVILKTREVRKKGGIFGLLSRPFVEVTAAIDPHPVLKRNEEKKGLFEKILKEVNSPEEETPSAGLFEEDPRDLKASFEKFRKECQIENGQLRVCLEEMRNEMRRISGYALRQPEAEIFPSRLTALLDRLVSNGLDMGTAFGLIRLLHEKLTPEELEDSDAVKVYIEQMVAGIFNRITPPGGEGEKEMPAMAFVGPTGSGKTTTLIKLASQYVTNKTPVTLVTLDTYRAGAIEQLKIYGRIIGAPVCVTPTSNELRKIIKQKKKNEVVLIDTPGRNYLNSDQMSELRDLEGISGPLETHLVLSSQTRERELSQMIGHFSVIPIDHLVFTKTDEVRPLGFLLTVMKTNRKPISYLTTGQRVPDDIEIATPKKMTELILN
ncbi:MAG: flagellar biosynthesis protein FlhF [Nitrospirae bacterium]|nr:flagellar biosynthesis protein FlhF [Nitrospirota bacterium]